MCRFLSHCCAFTVTFRSYLQTRRKDSREIRAGATAREWATASSSPSSPSLSISRNHSLSLGHLHGNSWCTYTTRRGARPEARIETTSLPRRTVEGCVGPGGCALDEAAAGESVLRILEVMSRAVLYNTRSRPFQSRPLSASSFRPRSASRRGTSTSALRGSWWKMEIANPSVFPSTSFIFKRLKNFFSPSGAAAQAEAKYTCRRLTRNPYKIKLLAWKKPLVFAVALNILILEKQWQ